MSKKSIAFIKGYGKRSRRFSTLDKPAIETAFADAPRLSAPRAATSKAPLFSGLLFAHRRFEKIIDNKAELACPMAFAREHATHTFAATDVTTAVAADGAWVW